MSELDELRTARDQAVEIARNLLALPSLPDSPVLQARLDELAAVAQPAAAAAAAAVRPPAPYEDGFICGSNLDDAEHMSWTCDVFATREEAIAAGNADVGWRGRDEGFETARIIVGWHTMSNPLDAETACDRAECSDWGESMLETWQDQAFGNEGKLLDELQAELDTLWSRFEDRHALGSWGYHTNDVEYHAFGELDDDGEPVVAPESTP